MTPGELLAAARAMLDDHDQTAVGAWPRAVAFLARQALEQALSDLWARTQATAGLSHCVMKTQLLCLPAYLEPRLARQTSYIWAALSSACHYHPYDLAPTASELSGWTTAVAGLIAAIAPICDPNLQSPTSRGEDPAP
jgi:hypothetical protein